MEVDTTCPQGRLQDYIVALPATVVEFRRQTRAFESRILNKSYQYHLVDVRLAFGRDYKFTPLRSRIPSKVRNTPLCELRRMTVVRLLVANVFFTVSDKVQCGKFVTEHIERTYDCSKFRNISLTGVAVIVNIGKAISGIFMVKVVIFLIW